MQLIVLLVLVAFVAKFFWWLAGIAVTVIVGRLIGTRLARRDDQAAARRRRDADLCARADRQNAQVLAGDYQLGVHGNYPPAVW